MCIISYPEPKAGSAIAGAAFAGAEMPRYFFHRLDGSAEIDTEGTELKDIHAARREAIVYAGESLKDQPELVWHDNDLRVEVSDASRMVLFTIVIKAIG
jgi:hypothetical protein